MRKPEPTPHVSAEDECRPAPRERRERQAPPAAIVSNPFRRVEDRLVDREADLRRNLHYRGAR